MLYIPHRLPSEPDHLPSPFGLHRASRSHPTGCPVGLSFAQVVPRGPFHLSPMRWFPMGVPRLAWCRSLTDQAVTSLRLSSLPQSAGFAASGAELLCSFSALLVREGKGRKAKEKKGLSVFQSFRQKDKGFSSLPEDQASCQSLRSCHSSCLSEGNGASEEQKPC